MSQHLASLTHAGIVEARREGNKVFYRIADATILRICEVVCDSVVARARSLRREAAARGIPASQPGGRRAMSRASGVLALGLWLLAAGAARATAEDVPVTLAEALALAEKGNPELASAAARVDAQLARTESVRRMSWPRVGPLVVAGRGWTCRPASSRTS